MSCPDCTAAAGNPNWGGYRAKCWGCEARHVAQLPLHLATAALADVRRSKGAEFAERFAAQATKEQERIKALKEIA